MKKFTLILAAMAFCFAASAQIGSFDSYGGPQVTVVLGNSTALTSAVSVTNSAVDITPFSGIAKIDVGGVVGSSATLALKVETSPDTTNWTQVATLAIATANSVLITNHYYGGTNLYATDTINMPGAITSASSSAGYVGSYVQPGGFTNSSVTISSSGVKTLGVNIGSQSQYIRTIWTAGGTASNGVSGTATLTAFNNKRLW